MRRRFGGHVTPEQNPRRLNLRNSVTSASTPRPITAASSADLAFWALECLTAMWVHRQIVFKHPSTQIWMRDGLDWMDRAAGRVGIHSAPDRPLRVRMSMSRVAHWMQWSMGASYCGSSPADPGLGSANRDKQDKGNDFARQLQISASLEKNIFGWENADPKPP